MSGQPTGGLYEEQWRKTGVNWSNLFQTLAELKDEIVNYAPLDDFLPPDVEFPHPNILLFGCVGSGRSSVFNTINSVFCEKIFNVAISGSAEHVLTKKLRKYPVMSCGLSGPMPMKFRIFDMRGLDEDHLMTRENMRFLLEGNIADRFPFDPSGDILANMPGFEKHPALHEKIHCVAIVQDGSIVDGVCDLQRGMLKNTKEMQTIMNSLGIGHSENVDVEQVPDSIPRGNFKPVQLPGPPTVITFDLETTGLNIPQVVILTKIDGICEEVKHDAASAFRSPRIERCVSQISEILGVRRNAVFPMKNYEHECQLDPSIDIMALLTLKGILNNCDAHLFNHYNEIVKEYSVSGSVAGQRKP